MNIAFLVLILIVAIVLILIVMVQNPKGGGLSSSFGGGGAQSMGGVQNTNNFLDKATWTLAITMFALILVSNFTTDRVGSKDFNPVSGDDIETTVPPADNAPAATTQNDSI